MKTKTKILTSLLTLVSVSASSGMLLAKNNNTQSLNSNNKVNNTLQFDAKFIGAREGTFTIEYTDVDHCTITSTSSFAAYDNFNFNGGKFESNGITYTITKIGKGAFDSNWTKRFHNCYLTIPSTIKEIGEKAFYNCSKDRGDKEIIGIEFEEGVEYIGENAFGYCCDLIEKYIKLPNSLQYIGDNAFHATEVEIFDLSALDHVISTECMVLYRTDPDSSWGFYRGCLQTYCLKKVCFKDEIIKSKYSEDNHWEPAIDFFNIK